MGIDHFDLSVITEPLLEWFSCSARVLPWREQPTPYRVWVSEIMLQQTRVEAVKPYFERFMEELPDVKALAECEEEQLLKLWEGLGYYNRVRNLQIAARQVQTEYQGCIPDEYEELLKLKGIGAYTAGAIASIAYGKAVPAVDGNVLRVISRVCADDSDIMKQSVRTKMQRKLQEMMPIERAGDFNQALMELGAVVCLPNGEPRCEQCPWNRICLAKKEGRIGEIPHKEKKQKRRKEERTVLLIRDGERVIIHKRQNKGLLAGMYEFPNEAGFLGEQEALDYVKKMGLTPLRIERLEDAKHIFSHVEWEMKGYLIRVSEFEQNEGVMFAELVDFKERYPMPSAFLAYARKLQIAIGKDKFVN